MLDYTNSFSPKDWQKKVGLDFGLRKIDEAKHYFLDKMKHNHLINGKHKMCRTLNNFFFFASADSGCVSVFAIASLVHVGIKNSAVKLKIFALTVGIKKYKSIANEKLKFWFLKP